jgi:hypothetical protein
MFEVGTDEPNVIARNHFGSKPTIENSSKIVLSSIPKKSQPTRKIKQLTGATLHALNAAPGGKFHVPKFSSRYATRVLVC